MARAAQGARSSVRATYGCSLTTSPPTLAPSDHPGFGASPSCSRRTPRTCTPGPSCAHLAHASRNTPFPCALASRHTRIPPSHAHRASLLIGHTLRAQLSRRPSYMPSPHVERHRTTRRHAPRKEEETQPDGRHASVSRHAARQRTEADAHAASPYSREHRVRRVRREPWVSAFNTRAGGWVRQDGVPAACRTRRTGCPAHALCVRVLDDRACAAEKWRHRQHSRVGSQDRMARHTWKHRVPPAWRPRPLASQSRRPVCF